MRESGGYVDAVSSLERNSVSSASDAMLAQHELKAKSETEKLIKMDWWKQKEVR